MSKTRHKRSGLRLLLVSIVAVLLLVTCTHGPPPWTCSDWSEAERRERVSERMFKSMHIEGQKIYAGFSGIEFASGHSGTYVPGFLLPGHWLVYFTLKGETRPDERMLAFLHCNGWIELSNLSRGG